MLRSTHFRQAADLKEPPTHQTLRWGARPLRGGRPRLGLGRRRHSRRPGLRAADCMATARVRAPRSGPRGTGLSERRPLAVPRLERGNAPNRSIGETKFLPMNTVCTGGRHSGLPLRRRSDERGCRRRSGSSLSLCFDICSHSLVRCLSWFRLNRPMSHDRCTRKERSPLS